MGAERTVEGATVGLELELRAEAAVPHAEVALVLPEGASVVDGPNPALVRIGAGQTVELEWQIECGHWGAFTLGQVAIRSRDAFGLFVYEQVVGAPPRR